jgi:hypothetical protein
MTSFGTFARAVSSAASAARRGSSSAVRSERAPETVAVARRIQRDSSETVSMNSGCA